MWETTSLFTTCEGNPRGHTQVDTSASIKGNRPRFGRKWPSEWKHGGNKSPLANLLYRGPDHLPYHHHHTRKKHSLRGRMHKDSCFSHSLTLRKIARLQKQPLEGLKRRRVQKEKNLADLRTKRSRWRKSKVLSYRNAWSGPRWFITKKTSKGKRTETTGSYICMCASMRVPVFFPQKHREHGFGIITTGRSFMQQKQHPTNYCSEERN